MSGYGEFLATKAVVVQPTGREISDGEIHPSLFPFQRDMVRWAVRKGRAALFEDTGLGKTRQQIEWARLTGERALILAPLAVARQTVAEGREADDERHICPLQLGTIERCVRLWSNEGETVLSPFAGIGSEGFVSVKHGRRFVGVELKPSYWRAGVRNLRRAENESKPLDMFAFAESSAG